MELDLVVLAACTRTCKALILNVLVALAGVEPGFFALSCFFKLLKPQSQEPNRSQESQALCTKLVHGLWPKISGDDGAMDGSDRLEEQEPCLGSCALNLAISGLHAHLSARPLLCRWIGLLLSKS
jgi:hypothetical protein